MVLKRKGTEPTGSADSSSKKRRKFFDADGPAHEPDASVRAETKERRKSLAIVSDPDSAKERVQDDLEEGYFARSNNKAKAKNHVNEQSSPPSCDGGSGEDEESTAPPQHESLAAKTSRKNDRTPKNKAKYVPPEETKEQRDERTIFMGNLPTEVAKSKVCPFIRDYFLRFTDTPDYPVSSPQPSTTHYLRRPRLQNRIYPLPLCRFPESHVRTPQVR